MLVRKSAYGCFSDATACCCCSNRMAKEQRAMHAGSLVATANGLSGTTTHADAAPASAEANTF